MTVKDSNTIDQKPGKIPGVSALVLAAGQGQRFDPTGVDYKLVQTLADGRSIIRTVCETLFDCVDDITVVCGARELEVTHALGGLPVRLVRCLDANAGMGASIQCGIDASPARVGWLVMLGDMPHVHRSTIINVAQHLLNGALIARPFYQQQPGHPVGFGVALRSELLSLNKAAGAQELMRKNAHEVVRINVDDSRCVVDIDTPQDLLANFHG